MKLRQRDIELIIDEIVSPEETTRRLKELKSYYIYEEHLHDYVLAEVKSKFPKTWQDYTIADYNLLKKVVDKKAKSYKKSPSRKLDKEKETEDYKAILESGSFDSTMKEIDKLMCQHKYCALGVMLDVLKDDSGERRDIYKFWSLAPYDFIVHRDSNDEIYAWSIPTGRTRKGENWTIWTDKSCVDIVINTPVNKNNKKDTKPSFETVINKENPKNINPWGMIPFIYIPSDASGSYPNTSALVEQTVKANFNLSMYLTSGNQQIGQLVLKHPKNQAFDNVTMGLRTAMNLPQEGGDRGDTTAEYIAPSPNLEGHKDSVVSYMTMILDQQGLVNVKVGSIDGMSFTSGFDRLIANADVQEIIEDNQGVFLKVENAVYKIIQKMNLVRSLYTFTSNKLSIVYSKPQILLSDSELLDNLKKKKELGLWDEWELVQEANPNLTEAQAKELVDQRSSRALDGKNVFNGAQVTSLVEVVAKVGLKEIPRESGVQILIASFGVSEELAEKIIPADSFTPPAPVNTNANF